MNINKLYRFVKSLKNVLNIQKVLKTKKLQIDTIYFKLVNV